MTTYEPTWRLRQAVYDALPDSFADDARQLLALDVAHSVAEHLTAELDAMPHAGRVCMQDQCDRYCRAQHRERCSCAIEKTRALLILA